MSVARFCEVMAYNPDLNNNREEILQELFRYERLKDKLSNSVEFNSRLNCILDKYTIDDGTERAYNELTEEIKSLIRDAII